jgi:hypothetical protein
VTVTLERPLELAVRVEVHVVLFGACQELLDVVAAPEAGKLSVVDDQVLVVAEKVTVWPEPMLLIGLPKAS